ncbi:hypothetical protein BJ508DRAFT_344515 [Ascobolus immersus RN42]|uniref:Uncharacterized protein n=1 Tax=Ascobolus immersus RN42 TaxID=1160509 RepID=A0A3N4IL14_ASCIM|nr:hypothetical protein BJ508DRAFT_344515 [Ascobolus immersus RN42]
MTTFLDLPPKIHLEIFSHHAQNLHASSSPLCTRGSYSSLITTALSANLPLIFALLPSNLTAQTWSAGHSLRPSQIAQQYSREAAWHLKQTLGIMAAETALYDAEKPHLRSQPPCPLDEPLQLRIARILEEVKAVVEEAACLYSPGHAREEAKRIFWRCVVEVWRDDVKWPVCTDWARMMMYWLLHSEVLHMVVDGRAMLGRNPWEKAGGLLKGEGEVERVLLQVAEFKSGKERVLAVQVEDCKADRGLGEPRVMVASEKLVEFDYDAFKATPFYKRLTFHRHWRGSTFKCHLTLEKILSLGVHEGLHATQEKLKRPRKPAKEAASKVAKYANKPAL